MKTADEIQAATETLAWYVATGGITRLLERDPDTAHNITGVVATLAWLHGKSTPIDDTLAQIEQQRRRQAIADSN